MALSDRPVAGLLTVIVPTRDEAENVAALLARIESALSGVPYEVLFVDDSDGPSTAAAILRYAAADDRVRLERRATRDGLGGAVMRGFALARGDRIAVMDADLQHPPEVLGDLVAALDRGSDMAVGSRFVPGGSDGGLGPGRKLVSLGARVLIWLVLGRARRLKDPTSGSFAVRTEVARRAPYRATGWKVLLELLPYVEPSRVSEVPLRFGARSAGTSKLSGRQGIDLVRQLWRLVGASPEDRRLYRFLLVGLSGVVLNTAVFLVLSRLGLVPEAAAPLSAGAAMLSNFVWNDRFTFGDRRRGAGLVRGGKAMLAQIAGIAIDTGVVAALHAGLGVPGLVSNLGGIAAAAGWNYGTFSAWVWRPGATPAGPAAFAPGEHERGHDRAAVVTSSAPVVPPIASGEEPHPVEP